MFSPFSPLVLALFSTPSRGVANTKTKRLHDLDRRMAEFIREKQANGGTDLVHHIRHERASIRQSLKAGPAR